MFTVLRRLALVMFLCMASAGVFSGERAEDQAGIRLGKIPPEWSDVTRKMHQLNTRAIRAKHDWFKKFCPDATVKVAFRAIARKPEKNEKLFALFHEVTGINSEKSRLTRRSAWYKRIVKTRSVKGKIIQRHRFRFERVPGFEILARKGRTLILEYFFFFEGGMAVVSVNGIGVSPAEFKKQAELIYGSLKKVFAKKETPEMPSIWIWLLGGVVALCVLSEIIRHVFARRAD